MQPTICWKQVHRFASAGKAMVHVVYDAADV
jgi:hypothetical protein